MHSQINFTTQDENHAQVWNFASAPALHPMKVRIEEWKCGSTAPGFLFVAPYTAFGQSMAGQTGSLMMDQAGNPVWFRPLKSRYIQNTDFKVQCYNGRPVLTMWQGTISGTQSDDPNLPDGDPEPGACYRIFDQHYKLIKRISACDGFTADVHEFTITNRNTALFTAIKQVSGNLEPYGGPADGYFDNYSIQEVDIHTGKLLFLWNVLEHVNPADSMLQASSAFNSNNIWDCFHVNSVEEGPDDTLLISMRNMWAIYQIDKKSGNILWQIGGKRSDFSFGPNAEFSWQHDARYRACNRISLFDDACCASQSTPPNGAARGLILKLDYDNKTAVVDRTYYHDPLLYVASQANVQQLYNCNQLIGWGQQPYLSEFEYEGNTREDPSLNILYEMQFPEQNISYRAFKYVWAGLPLYPPSIAVKACREGSIVYASWNGSTETAAWIVWAGPSRENMQTASPCVKRKGFETQIHICSSGPFFQVNALNNCGRVIGCSRVVCINGSGINE